jgi:hypothetical protein
VPKIVAMCSCPRLGYMDFMGQSVAAFSQNKIEYRNLYGVFWSQSLTNGMKIAVENGYDYIVTTDYDSIYNGETVAQLVRLAEQNPNADAICAMQMGRFSGLLVSNEEGYLLKKDLQKKPLVPVGTGHFGLTIFRCNSLRDMKKPWFWSRPDEDGEWKRNAPGKLDDDIYFWDNFKASGKQLYLAPRLVIGHLELLIKWPGEDLEGIYETMQDFQDFGPPADAWK